MILRDTGSSQSLIQKGVLPLSSESYCGKDVLIVGVGGESMNIPLHKAYIESDLVQGEVIVGVTDSLPVNGVSMILGNDLAGSRVQTEPVVSQHPTESTSTQILEDQFPNCLPACVLTRATKAKLDLEQLGSEPKPRVARTANHSIDLADTFMHGLEDTSSEHFTAHEIHSKKTRESIIAAQQSDPEIKELFDQALSSEEAEKVPQCYVVKDGLLMRKWRCPTAKVCHHWDCKYQIVVPKEIRTDILELGHDAPTASHLGVKKTKSRIFEHFWWPGAGRDIAEYVKTCHTCQMVGKPNQKPRKVPLHPIPVMDEAFSQLIIDIVGPLPKTSSGHVYALTIMCTATRFPEAIPLRTCTATAVSKALLKFFTQFGIPKTVISDQGTHFTARVIDQVLEQLGCEHRYASAYHAQTQGALERFHQTMKTMIRTYVHDHKKDWDQGLPFLLFAIRDSVQESLGFTPNELVFGHQVRGPLKLIKDRCFDNDCAENVLSYVQKIKERMHNAITMAHENLKASQQKMKTWYDKDAVNREFGVGDLVLALLPIPGSPLQVSYTVHVESLRD